MHTPGDVVTATAIVSSRGSWRIIVWETVECDGDIIFNGAGIHDRGSSKRENYSETQRLR